MKEATKTIIDSDVLGRKGTPRFPEAYGRALPTKVVPVEEGNALTEHPPLTIEEIRTLSLASIDKQAEEKRLEYITPGVGQSMTYARKVEEAKGFFVDSSGEFPMLSASIGIDGENIEQVAQVVLNLDYQWSLIGSRIESIRLGAKLLVSEAQTIEEIQNITNSINWEIK